MSKFKKNAFCRYSLFLGSLLILYSGFSLAENQDISIMIRNNTQTMLKFQSEGYDVSVSPGASVRWNFYNNAEGEPSVSVRDKERFLPITNAKGCKIGWGGVNIYFADVNTYGHGSSEILASITAVSAERDPKNPGGDPVVHLECTYRRLVSFSTP